MTGVVFDLSFTKLMTRRLAGALYVAAIVMSGLLALIAIGYGLTQSLLGGLLGLLIGGFASLAFFVVARLCLKLAIALFRIADHTAEIVERQAEIAVNTASTRQRQGASSGA